jgi:hypothetical protein
MPKSETHSQRFDTTSSAAGSAVQPTSAHRELERFRTQGEIVLLIESDKVALYHASIRIGSSLGLRFTQRSMFRFLIV